MAAIPQYSAVNAPFVDPSTGRLTLAANVFLRDLWERTGGAVAPTNTELAATEYADAGIESMQLDIYELRDTLFAMTSEVNSLRALVQSLDTRVSALESLPDDLRERVQVLSVRVEAIEQGVEI
jgi:prophage DNA circulation protein